jgi:rhodanese-related sulfurtransferase
MSNVKRVSPREAKALMDEGYVYVDVRSEPEFLSGHPQGAVNVPLFHMGPAGMTPNPEFLDVMQARFPKDAKLVLGCRSGGRSLQAAEMLLKVGYTDVVDQRAGYEGARGPFGNVTEKGWAPEGLPVEEGAKPGQSYEDVKRQS